MDQEKYLILINGQDRTDSVAHFQLESEYCEIIYTKSSKAYHYRRDKVQVLELRQRFKADGWIVETTDRSLTDLDEILDYGTWYRFVWIGKKAVSYPKADVVINQNCLTDQKVKDLFAYFKETAEAVGLTADNGMNLLSSQYERCKRIDSGSVLASYLNPAAKLNVWSKSEPKSGSRKCIVLSGEHHPGTAGHREDADHPEHHCQCRPKWKNGGGGFQ